MTDRKPIIMLVDDEEIPDVVMARAMEHHVRTGEFGRLVNEGHVKVLEDNDVTTIRCSIQGEIFSCPRDVFPTTELMARLQLAVAAGRSCRNDPSPEFTHQLDAYRYAASRVWLDEGTWTPNKWLVGDALEAGYANVSKVTKGYRHGKIAKVRP